MKRAKVLITFDDGLYSHRMAAEALTNRGLKGAFAVITSRVGQPGALTGLDVLNMAHQGHFICNHSACHKWAGRGEPKPGRKAYPRAGITKDYLEGMRWGRKLAKSDSVPANIRASIRMDYLCVPYGTANVFGPEHLRELLGHFRWIRLTVGAPNPTDKVGWIAEGGKRIYPGDYRGPVIGISAAADARYPDRIKETLGTAIKVGGLAVLLYHDVAHVLGRGQDITWEQFESDLDFMKEQKEAGLLESVLPPDVR